MADRAERGDPADLEGPAMGIVTARVRLAARGHRAILVRLDPLVPKVLMVHP